MPFQEDSENRAAINALISLGKKNWGGLAPDITKLLAMMSPQNMKTMLQEFVNKLTNKELARELLSAMMDHVKNHPHQIVFILGGILLMSSPLMLAGFGALGPVAGSIAAAWQASIGASVTAGSMFAVLQSWGMQYAVSIPAVGAVVVGGTMAYATAAPHIRARI